MSAILAASSAMAEAKLASEAGAAALAVAIGEVEEISGRIAELEGERSRIAGARKVGKTSPTDGARLAELACDLDGLREILVERQAAASLAGAESQRLTQAVAGAQWAVDNATDTALLAGLRETATELDRLLGDAVNQLTAVARRLGISRGTWFPTSALAQRLYSLDLEKGIRA